MKSRVLVNLIGADAAKEVPITGYDGAEAVSRSLRRPVFDMTRHWPPGSEERRRARSSAPQRHIGWSGWDGIYRSAVLHAEPTPFCSPPTWYTACECEHAFEGDSVISDYYEYEFEVNKKPPPECVPGCKRCTHRTRWFGAPTVAEFEGWLVIPCDQTWTIAWEFDMITLHHNTRKYARPIIRELLYIIALYMDRYPALRAKITRLHMPMAGVLGMAEGQAGGLSITGDGGWTSKNA